MNSNSYWTLIKDIDTENAEYLCVCGNVKVVRKRNVLDNRSKSCGCMRNIDHIFLGKTKEFRQGLKRIFSAMKQRCYNENHFSYKYYGGKGIGIFENWLNESNSFYIWAMNNGYFEGASIDRIDPNLSYYPDNCRWVTVSENSKNMMEYHSIRGTGSFSKESVATLTEVNRSSQGTQFYMIDKNNDAIFFRCLMEAALHITKIKSLNTAPFQIKKNISACLHKKRKTCHGYSFKFKEDYELGIETVCVSNPFVEF